MEIICTPIAEISFNETDRILHVKVLDGAEMDLENTKIHYDEINKLVNNKEYLALVDATNQYLVKKEAWKYASSKEVVWNRKAVAHYNSSFANTMTTKFFKSFYHTAMPVQIFNTKEEAIEWLKTIPLTR